MYSHNRVLDIRSELRFDVDLRLLVGLRMSSLVASQPGEWEEDEEHLKKMDNDLRQRHPERMALPLVKTRKDLVVVVLG